MESFRVALAFLTVLPAGPRGSPSAAAVARSRFWYPLVGVLLGALLGGWTALLGGSRLGTSVGAFLVLVAWVVLTGALHLDGLCDLCDGLLGGRTPEDRLRILKDPHLGTFGLAGGVLLLLGKFVLLAEAMGRSGPEAGWLVGAAVAASRCLVLVVAAGARYPRPEGTGKLLVEATRGREVPLYAALAIALSLPASFADDPSPFILAPFLAALAVVLGLRWWCVRRLGGITGDCLGAAIEVAECTFLLAAVLATSRLR